MNTGTGNEQEVLQKILSLLEVGSWDILVILPKPIATIGQYNLDETIGVSKRLKYWHKFF